MKVLAVYEAVEKLIAPLAAGSRGSTVRHRGRSLQDNREGRSLQDNREGRSLQEDRGGRSLQEDRGGRSLQEWAEPLRTVLQTVYGTRPIDREKIEDRYLYEALKHLAAALDELARVPSELQPEVDARQACRIVLGLLAGEGIPPP